MAGFNGREEDYTYDDSMENEYEEEIVDEDDISLMETISGWVKKVPDLFKKTKEDSEEDEEDDEEHYEKKKKNVRSVKAKRTYNDEEDDEPEVDGKYTREEYDSYDKKYGTRGSYARAAQSEKNKAKIFNGTTGAKERRRNTETGNVTKIYADEKYKGNVKGVLKFAPKNIDDTNDIADSLMNQYAVIIDVKGMAKSDILRILDFVDGVAYVLKYSFDEISKEIYMCAPKGFLKNFTKYNHD